MLSLEQNYSTSIQTFLGQKKHINEEDMFLS